MGNFSPEGRDRRIEVVGAAIFRAGRCLVAQRGRGKVLELKWEFPGGKVEPGEEPRAALVREIIEELAAHIEVLASLGVAHCPPLRLEVFSARLLSPDLVQREHNALRWVSADELSSLDFAPADVPLVPAVERALREHDDLA